MSLIKFLKGLFRNEELEIEQLNTLKAINKTLSSLDSHFMSERHKSFLSSVKAQRRKQELSLSKTKGMFSGKLKGEL